MAYCPQCGAATEGKFCEKCGAAVTQGGSTTSGSTTSGATYTTSTQMSAEGLPMNIVSAICYIVPVICPIIFLVVDPYKRNKDVRFAALQSLFLTIALFVLNIAIGIVVGADYGLAYNLYRLLRLAELILICFLAFKAFQNQKFVLPVIGPLAQKQA